MFRQFHLVEVNFMLTRLSELRPQLCQKTPGGYYIRRGSVATGGPSESVLFEISNYDDNVNSAALFASLQQCIILLEKKIFL
jgi:hypothetical protein